MMFKFHFKKNERWVDMLIRLRIELYIYFKKQGYDNKEICQKIGISRRGLGGFFKYNELTQYKKTNMGIVKYEINSEQKTKRNVDCIILHCSDSDSPYLDKISEIRKIHMKERGFSDVGYHYFIKKNGGLEKGRDENTEGAHCENHNKTSMGICLHGKNHFETAQFITLARLIKSLQSKYEIGDRIFPHNYFNKNKTCPNFEIDIVFEFMEDL